MVKSHFFIEGKFVATSELRDTYAEKWGSSEGFRSRVYICSTCGKEWARVLCEPSASWEARSRPCRAHEPAGAWDWTAVPGALTNLLDKDPAIWERHMAWENLPFAVLLWEVQRELDHFNRSLQNGEQS